MPEQRLALPGPQHHDTIIFEDMDAANLTGTQVQETEFCARSGRLSREV